MGGSMLIGLLQYMGGRGAAREGEKEKGKEGEREVEDTCQYVQHIHCMNSLQAQTHTQTHIHNITHSTTHNTITQ